MVSAEIVSKSASRRHCKVKSWRVSSNSSAHTIHTQYCLFHHSRRLPHPYPAIRLPASSISRLRQCSPQRGKVSRRLASSTYIQFSFSREGWRRLGLFYGSLAMGRDWIFAKTSCYQGESCLSENRTLLMSRFDVPYDCSVELSPLGNQFLTDIFEAYDKVCPKVSF